VESIECDLEELGPVELVLVSSRYSEHYRIWKQLLERYHYLGAGPLCGAQLRYLIKSSGAGSERWLSVRPPGVWTVGIGGSGGVKWLAGKICTEWSTRAVFNSSDGEGSLFGFTRSGPGGWTDTKGIGTSGMVTNRCYWRVLSSGSVFRDLLSGGELAGGGPERRTRTAGSAASSCRRTQAGFSLSTGQKVPRKIVRSSQAQRLFHRPALLRPRPAAAGLGRRRIGRFAAAGQRLRRRAMELARDFCSSSACSPPAAAGPRPRRRIVFSTIAR
jgi:hypothetical protein